MKKGFTAVQLNLIAMIVIIIYHISWTLTGITSPITRILQLVGNMAIPISCLLIAEGYRNSSQPDKYIMRMMFLWLVSIIPYYLFFHFTYGVHQNLMFDLFLGLLTLKIINSKVLKKKDRIVMIILIEIISCIFSTYPIVILLYIMTFYYEKDFKKRALCTFVASLVPACLLLLLIYLHNRFGILRIGWTEYDAYACLGFNLAIPFIKLYNNKRGAKFYFRYVAYVAYPIHFVILEMLFRANERQVYLGYIHLHLLTIALTVGLGIYTIKAKPSKAQLSNVVLILFSLFYMIGYFLKITTIDPVVARTSIKIEYIGFAGMVIAYTWFFESFTQRVWGRWMYLLEVTMTTILIMSVLTMDYNHLFIKSSGVKIYPCHGTVVLEPGIVFFLFHLYTVILCVASVIVCIKKYRVSSGKARVRYVLLGMANTLPLFIYIIKYLGVNEEYDFIPLATFGYTVLFTIAIVKYEYYDSLQTESELDCLTGVSNRSYFVERVEVKLSKKKAGSLFMLDMDNFKTINDSYGHGVGDKVLIILGDSLKQVIGNENLICRLGGDEFSIFILDMISTEELGKVAEKILATFRENVNIKGLEFPVSLSLGIAIYDGKMPIKFDSLYEKADKALYLAKNSGKGQFKFYGRNREA